MVTGYERDYYRDINKMVKEIALIRANLEELKHLLIQHLSEHIGDRKS